MFIGHLPAGFISARLLFTHLKSVGVSYTAFIAWGMFGAIIPDIDMVYFYLIDHRQHHHHSYITHFPIVWLSLLIVSSAWFCKTSQRKNAVLVVIFSLNAFIHIILDTIVGDIWWLAPFVDRPFSFATVPAMYQPWWLNFLLHWSFVLEMMLVIYALYLATRRYN